MQGRLAEPLPPRNSVPYPIARVEVQAQHPVEWVPLPPDEQISLDITAQHGFVEAELNVLMRSHRARYLEVVAVILPGHAMLLVL